MSACLVGWVMCMRARIMIMVMVMMMVVVVVVVVCVHQFRLVSKRASAMMGIAVYRIL